MVSKVNTLRDACSRQYDWATRRSIMSPAPATSRPRQLAEMGTWNIHPSQDMWEDASRGSDNALEHIWILLGALQQALKHRQHLEAHDLFVLVRECRSCEGLGDKVGSPAPQLEGGVWGGEWQDAVHDRLVVAGVDEDGFSGVIQLLELLAHGLHSVGGHDGQVGWHDGLGSSWVE